MKSRLEKAQLSTDKLNKEVTCLKSEVSSKYQFTRSIGLSKAMKSELKTQQLLHEEELLEKRIEQLTTT